MEFNTLPDLMNTGFTIIEIGLFYGDWDTKIRWIQDGDFCSVLNRGRRMKTLQLLVAFF